MKRIKEIMILFLLLIIASAIIGCTDQLSNKKEDQEKMNVVFILIDTLRADHVGAYGYERNTTPNIDSFADENILFLNARSQASCTFPSVNSFITSRYPYHFINNQDQTFINIDQAGKYKYTYLGIPDNIISLPEILKQEGYNTHAITASPIVKSKPLNKERFGSFAKGYDTFDEECFNKEAECLNKKAFEILENEKGNPFFLYIHYMEPHGPYNPPEDFKKIYSDREYDGQFQEVNDRNPKLLEKMYREDRLDEITEKETQFLIDGYEDEIAYFDSQFRIFMQKIEKMGISNNTMIIIASDHGEEFLEHDRASHCHTVYDPVIKVPLIMKIPEVEDIRRDKLVQNLDIVPTILDYLDIDYKDYNFDGKSLRPMIEDDVNINEYGYASQNEFRSINSNKYMFIKDIVSNSSELYDLKNDPEEQEDLSETRTKISTRMQTDLYTWLLELEGSVSSEDSIQNAEKIEEELLALGYLG